MNKKGGLAFWISIIFVVLFVAFLFVYFALFSLNNEGVYTGKVIENPVSGLTQERAILEFDESFVFYFLYNLKAYNLHNPPLSSNYPKIEVDIEGEIFSSSVKKGTIFVSNVQRLNKDIIIRTTKKEIVKMMQDKEYVAQSFNDGKSNIEFIAGKRVLFAKGYLNLYNNLIGKSVTGNLIRIATD